MRDRIVARIRANRLSSLVVRLTSHRHGRLVDLRIYDDPSFKRGFGATEVGIAIRPDLLRSVIEALEMAEDAAIREGLIDVSRQPAAKPEDHFGASCAKTPDPHALLHPEPERTRPPIPLPEKA